MTAKDRLAASQKLERQAKKLRKIAAVVRGDEVEQ